MKGKLTRSIMWQATTRMAGTTGGGAERMTENAVTNVPSALAENCIGKNGAESAADEFPQSTCG